MAALRLEGTFLKIVSGGGLGLTNRRGGLESDTEIDRCTVRNTSLDATGVVCLGGQTLLGGCGASRARFDFGNDERVVMNGSRYFTTAES